MITEDPHKTPSWLRTHIAVFTGEKLHDDDGLNLYPFMTISMELEEYNLLEIAMPKFLIGQEFEIIITSWEDDCDCDVCNCDCPKCRNSSERHGTITKPCGEFIFHLMPHEFFRFYEGIP